MSAPPYITSMSLSVSSGFLWGSLTMPIPLTGLTYPGINSIQITNNEIIAAFNSAPQGEQFASSLITTYGGLNYDELSNTITSTYSIYTPKPGIRPIITPHRGVI